MTHWLSYRKFHLLIPDLSTLQLEVWVNGGCVKQEVEVIPNIPLFPIPQALRHPIIVLEERHITIGQHCSSALNIFFCCSDS